MLDELKSSLAHDRDDYIFAVTEKSGHVAMVLIEKTGHVYINEQAKEKLGSFHETAKVVNSLRVSTAGITR